MKPRGVVGMILGALLIALGAFLLLSSFGPYGLVPMLLGAALVYQGLRPGRTSLILFGHACVVVGCILVTLGLYILPSSQPTLMHVFLRPLFWGLFSIFGGICALYHGFCQCFRRRPADCPAAPAPPAVKTGA